MPGRRLAFQASLAPAPSLVVAPSSVQRPALCVRASVPERATRAPDAQQRQASTSDADGKIGRREALRFVSAAAVASLVASTSAPEKARADQWDLPDIDLEEGKKKPPAAVWEYLVFFGTPATLVYYVWEKQIRRFFGIR
eukprot:tig00000792_g4206.t1